MSEGVVSFGVLTSTSQASSLRPCSSSQRGESGSRSVARAARRRGVEARTEGEKEEGREGGV